MSELPELTPEQQQTLRLALDQRAKERTDAMFAYDDALVRSAETFCKTLDRAGIQPEQLEPAASAPPSEQEWLKVGDNVYIASRGEIDATPLIQPDLEPPPLVNGRIVWTMKAALWNCTEAELARLVKAARDLPYRPLSNENGGLFTVEAMLEVLQNDPELLEVFTFARAQGAVYLIASVLP